MPEPQGCPGGDEDKAHKLLTVLQGQEARAAGTRGHKPSFWTGALPLTETAGFLLCQSAQSNSRRPEVRALKCEFTSNTITSKDDKGVSQQSTAGSEPSGNRQQETPGEEGRSLCAGLRAGRASAAPGAGTHVPPALACPHPYGASAVWAQQTLQLHGRSDCKFMRPSLSPTEPPAQQCPYQHTPTGVPETSLAYSPSR